MAFREFEIKYKPLFASMRRAKAALAKKHCSSCDVSSFFDYIEKRYGTDAQNVEYVTFYDYYDTRDNIKYNIAYLYTTPSLKIRDILFNEREEITMATGWYPMVSGKRAGFTRLKNSTTHDFYGLLKHKPPYVHLGRPLSIRSVAEDISSTAMLLKCEKGNILLDTGFGVDPNVIEHVNFIFISHFHKDHTGGLYGFLKEREVPVILSDITLEYLLNLPGIEQAEKERLVRNAVLVERMRDNLPINRTIEFFDSFHCPGAFGIKYKFFDECIVYPGDMCLSNGFYDYSNDFETICNNNIKGKTSIITDCALVPRGNFAITDEDFDIIESKVVASQQNQIFASRSCEMLFNVYIRLFKLAAQQQKPWLFVVNDELFDLLQNTLRTWLLPKYVGDPFIKHVIGKSGSNYAETQRLYNVSNVSQFADYTDKKVIYLLTLDDLGKMNNIIDTSAMDIFLTGPLAIAKNIDELLNEYDYGTIYKLSSPDWSFHSDRESIRDLLCQTTDMSLQYILFHAYPKDIKKFLREIGEVDTGRISFISKNELML